MPKQPTNKDNKLKQDLEKLWKQFYTESMLKKMPNKISKSKYA